MKRYKDVLPKPVNVTEIYMHDIAVSLRRLEVLMQGSALMHGVENVRVKNLTPEMADEILADDILKNREEKVDGELDGQMDMFEEEVDYESKTVPELKDIVSDMGVVGYSNMRKDELLEIIRGE